MNWEEFFDDTEDLSEMDIDLVVRTGDAAFDRLERELLDRLTPVLQYPTELSPIEWAEEEPFVISDESGAPKPGPFLAENGSPIMKYLIDWWGDPAVRIMIWAIAAQFGKTLGINICAGYSIVHNPTNTLIVYPKEQVALNKAKADYWPNFRATKAIKDRIEGGLRNKYRRSTSRRMVYPGGELNFASGQSNSEVVSFPNENVIVDELERVPEGPEGDIVVGTMQRQVQYPNSKWLGVSTVMGSEKESKILKLALMDGADQTTPHSRCLVCDHEWHMTWEDVAIPKDESGRMIAEGSTVKCPNKKCGHKHSDAEVSTMVSRVRLQDMKQMGKFTCCNKVHDPKDVGLWNEEGIALCPECEKPRSKEHRSIVESFLYSNVSLTKRVRQFIHAYYSRDPAAMKQFVNQALSRGYDGPRGTEEGVVDKLMSQGMNVQDEYGPGVVVPPWVKILTSSVDVQRGEGGAGRLEWKLKGHGDGMETITLKKLKIPGNADDEATWEKLDEHRMKFYPGVEDEGLGRRYYPVVMTAVDVGDQGRAIAKHYISKWVGKGVIPVRGYRDADLFDGELVADKHTRVHHFKVGTSIARDILSRRFLVKKPKRKKGEPEQRVPELMHFAEDDVSPDGVPLFESGITEDYFHQLTNFRVKLVKDARSGGLKEVYDKDRKSDPDEDLDLEIYNMAALEWVLISNGVNEIEELLPKWRYLSELLEVAEGDASDIRSRLAGLTFRDDGDALEDAISEKRAKEAAKKEEPVRPKNVAPKAKKDEPEILGLNPMPRRETSRAGRGERNFDPRGRGGRS